MYEITHDFLSRKDRRELAEERHFERIEEECEKKVSDPASTYFWANSENIDEAINESITPKHNIKNGLTYQEQLKMLITTGKYDAYGKLCEAISKEYWVKHLVDLVS